MNVRKFITNLDSLKKAGLDFVKHDKDQKAVYKATMVNMYLMVILQRPYPNLVE